MMNDILVLCYHAVSTRWPASLSVTLERFERQLEELVRRGYRGVTFTDAVTDPPPGKVVAVTFDDGFRSVVTLAFPILERLGLPATLFVTTDHVGTGQPMVWSGLESWVGTEHEPELVAASWPELSALADSGWEIGAHTCSHPHLTRVGTSQLTRELTDSRAAVADQLGRPCTSMAYPYGDHDPHVTAAAGEAGFLAAATLPPHWHRPEPLRWPRVYIHHDDDTWRYHAKISRSVRSARGVAAAMSAWAPAGWSRDAPVRV